MEGPGTLSGPGRHLVGAGGAQVSEGPRLEFPTFHGAQQGGVVSSVSAAGALLLVVADSQARQAGRRGSAPVDAGLKGPPPRRGCPQGRRQLPDWRPAHGVLEHSGSHGLSPRPRGKDRELRVGLRGPGWGTPHLPSSPSPTPQLWGAGRCLNHQFRKAEPQKHTGPLSLPSRNAPKEIVGVRGRDSYERWEEPTESTCRGGVSG